MATPPETQTRPDTQTRRSTSSPIEAEKMRRHVAVEVEVPVHKKAATIGYELKETGMNETTADTIGSGFVQVAGAVSGLGKIFTDGFETLLQRIDDVRDGLNKRMDKLDARMDKMDDNNRAEHRANRMFMLGILGLFTTVFLTVGGGMFFALNSKIDANTALIRENSEKIDKLDDKVDAVDAKVDAVDAKVDAVDAKVDAVDAKVERILGILEGREAQ